MIRPNRSHPLNRGRLAWWLQLPGRANNTSVLVDCWGSLTASSPAMPTATAGLGPVGWAGKYDGSSQYARTTCPTLTAFTVVAWVRFNTFAGASLVKNWANTIPGYLHWDASTAGAGTVRLYVTATGGTGIVTDGATISTGVPYRLAATAGGGALALYRNGVPVGTDTYSGTLSSTLGYLGIGCKLNDAQTEPEGGSATLLDGTMGDVSLWDRALSEAEIAMLDYEMRVGYPSMLIRDRTPLRTGTGQAFRPWYSPAYAGFLGTGAA